MYLGLCAISKDFTLSREQTLGHFLTSVLMQFRLASIDPGSPHTLVSETYRTGGSNRFIAMHSRVIHSGMAGDLITSDHTPLGRKLRR